jgi:RIP metalloprotease RseP
MEKIGGTTAPRWADEVDAPATAAVAEAPPGPPAPADTAAPVEEGRPPHSPWLHLALIAAAVLALRSLGLGAALVIFGLLVSLILHELGHFWVARACGMKVTEFFIGVGPRIWSFRRGEVEYGIKAAPIAAYVKIIGMMDFDEVDPADEPRAYRSQSTPKRLAAVFAGPGANILLAFALLFGSFLFASHPTDKWTVADVTAGGAAQQAGLGKGDRLVAINGVPVGDFDAFRAQIDTLAGQPVVVRVEGDNGVGRDIATTLGWRLDAGASAAVPAKPALTPNDEILSLDGVAVPRYEDLQAKLAETGPPATLRIRRPGGEYELAVTRPLTLPADGAAGFLGVRPEHQTVQETPIGAAGEAGRTGVYLLGENVKGIVRFLSPSGLSSLVGQVTDVASGADATANQADKPALTPVADSPPPSAAVEQPTDRPISIIGIVSVGSRVADDSIVSLLAFLALVNLALACINLLPVYPFDGGHIAVALYEGIRSRIQRAPYRADATKLMPVLYGVICLLMVLMVSTVMLDVLKPL